MDGGDDCASDDVEAAQKPTMAARRIELRLHGRKAASGMPEPPAQVRRFATRSQSEVLTLAPKSLPDSSISTWRLTDWTWHEPCNQQSMATCGLSDHMFRGEFRKPMRHGFREMPAAT